MEVASAGIVFSTALSIIGFQFSLYGVVESIACHV